MNDTQSFLPHNQITTSRLFSHIGEPIKIVCKRLLFRPSDNLKLYGPFGSSPNTISVDRHFLLVDVCQWETTHSTRIAPDCVSTFGSRTPDLFFTTCDEIHSFPRSHWVLKLFANNQFIHPLLNKNEIFVPSHSPLS